MKHTPVSRAFLKQRLPPGIRVVNYKHLKGKHRSQVFTGSKPVVVLIPKEGSKVGHFVVLIPRERHIEYFSSLGGSWESELRQMGEPLDIFRKLLGKKWIYNQTRLQSGEYNINTCASWVLTRVILHEMKLRDFLKLFRRRSIQTPDDLVSIMTLLHFAE